MKTCYYFFILIALTLWIGCNNTPDDPVCTENISINAIFPFTGTVKGPVLIQGGEFSREVEVWFEDFPATIVDREETYISTRVPSALAGTEGRVTVKVIDGACVATIPFDIEELGSSWNIYTVNAPVFVVPDLAAKLPISYPTEDCPSKVVCERTFVNPYGSTLTLTEIILNQNGSHISSTFSGSEFVTGMADVEGTYDPITNEVELVRQAAFTGENREVLSGGFYQLNLSTPAGPMSGTFLVLTSQASGYQYIYEPS